MAAKTSAASAILDFEGGDGVKAGDDKTVEYTFHVLALSLCSTLIINIYEQQVTTTSGSGMGILKPIMEIYLTISEGYPECVYIYCSTTF